MAAPDTIQPPALDDWLIAIRAPKVGARRLMAGLDRHGSISALRAAARGGRSGLPAAAEAYFRQPDEARLATDRAWLTQPGHHLLTWGDDWYPSLLADASGAPVVLFVVGDPGVLWQPQVAVVGSRQPSSAGRRQAYAFAAELAQRGLVITSGLAAGIDGEAHRAALEAGGRTIAVLGTGPDRVYPAAHRELAQQIAAQGALVTELPPGTRAQPGHFPARNRIISGLALGVLVAEAGDHSGSLITARLAAEQGREVMAIPGPIHHVLARGCHRLIREGARLVDCVPHVIEALYPLAGRLADRLHQALSLDQNASPPPAAGIAALGEPERRLLKALGVQALSVDELVEAVDLTPEAVSSMLLMLELQGLVICHQGGTWSRHHEINL